MNGYASDIIPMYRIPLVVSKTKLVENQNRGSSAILDTRLFALKSNKHYIVRKSQPLSLQSTKSALDLSLPRK